MDFLTEHYLVIDCGSSYLKGVLYSSSPKGNIVLRTEIMSLEESLLDEPLSEDVAEQEDHPLENSEDNGLDSTETRGDESDKDAKSEPSELSIKIAHFLKRYFPEEKNVIIGMSSEHYFTRNMNIPVGKAEQVREMIPFEVEGILPVSLDDAEVLGVLRHVSEQETEVVACAVTHEGMKSSVAGVLEAGYFPRMLIPENTGLASLVRLMDDGLYKNRTIAQIDIGGTGTIINILEDGILSFSRSVPHGSCEITHDIASILGVTFETAERIKLDVTWDLTLEENDSITYDNEEGESVSITRAKVKKINEAVKRVYDEILKEIYRTLLSAPYNEVAVYYLSGGGSLLTGIHSYFEESLQVPVLEYPFSIENVGSFAPWATAVGIREHSRIRGKERLDFLGTPAGKLLKKGDINFREISPPVWIMGAALVFILASFFTGMIRDKQEAEKYHAKTVALAASIPGVKKTGDPLKQAVAICNTRLRGNSYASGQGTVLDLMQSVTSLFPPKDELSLTFRKFVYSGKDLDIELEMDSLTDVSSLQERLSKTDIFKDVSIDSDMRANKKVRVKIHMTPLVSKTGTGIDCK